MTLTRVSFYYVITLEIIEFLIESFDGTSLLDQDSGTEEAPLRNLRNFEDGLDPTTQNYKLMNQPAFNN